MEINFCRRCGQSLTKTGDHQYICKSGHRIYANASPAVGVIFINDRKETLLAIRKIDPGKGKYDMPGGFCDDKENYELAIERELKEELGINPSDYSPPEFLLSYIDPYEYGGETLTILACVFTSSLKPNVVLRPTDDVAEVVSLKYEAFDKGKIHFPSHMAGLKLLHERGNI